MPNLYILAAVLGLLHAIFNSLRRAYKALRLMLRNQYHSSVQGTACLTIPNSRLTIRSTTPRSLPCSLITRPHRHHSISPSSSLTQSVSPDIFVNSTPSLHRILRLHEPCAQRCTFLFPFHTVPSLHISLTKVHIPSTCSFLSRSTSSTGYHSKQR